MTYMPPASATGILGKVVSLLNQATRIGVPLVGAKTLLKLPGGQIYFDSKLDLDDDGSSYAKQDPDGQAQTSLSDAKGNGVDANAVPYFVLPVHGFYRTMGVKLGDIAAVIYNGKLAFAIFADAGPHNKIGEGSIELHRLLGHETIVNGKLHDVGIDNGVVTIVFPGSGNGKLLSNDKINEIGQTLFNQLSK